MTNEVQRNAVEEHPWNAMRHPRYVLWGSLSLWAGLLLVISQTVYEANLFPGVSWAGAFLLGAGVILITAATVSWGLTMAEAY